MFKKLLCLFLLSVTCLSGYAEFKDPTQPAYPVNSDIKNLESQSEEKPKLSAIWISPKAKWADLNGVRVRQGQTIGNIKIIKIHTNMITINQNGTVKTLQLVQRPYQDSTIQRIRIK